MIRIAMTGTPTPSLSNATDIEARKAEIAENLHRAELTVQERADHIAEWVRLTEVSAQVAPKPQGGRPESGVRAAARELGVERTEAHRAVKIASPPWPSWKPEDMMQGHNRHSHKPND
jgi:ParB family chromosome partitioning protein